MTTPTTPTTTSTSQPSLANLTPETVDYILAITSDAGPWGEDLHFVIVSGEATWTIPNAQSERVFDWLKTFPAIDYDNAVRASAYTQRGLFILWNRLGPPAVCEAVVKTLEGRLEALLVRQTGAEAPAARLQAKQVIAAYQAPSRSYHNLRHIIHCLWELDAHPPGSFDRDAIELAIWYHDIVYDATSKRNEQASAERLRSDFSALGSAFASTASANIANIEDMILASTHAGGAAVDEATALFLDIDLAILGRNAFEYTAYMQGVRLEYAHVPSLLFRMGRKKLLAKFLSAPIYRTDWFRGRYEGPARENIQRELRS